VTLPRIILGLWSDHHLRSALRMVQTRMRLLGVGHDEPRHYRRREGSIPARDTLRKVAESGESGGPSRTHPPKTCAHSVVLGTGLGCDRVSAFAFLPWIIRTRYGPQPEEKAACSLHVEAPGGPTHG
jgi:hypothetical protein